MRINLMDKHLCSAVGAYFMFNIYILIKILLLTYLNN